MRLKEKLKNWYLNFTQFKWTIGIAEFEPTVILDPKSKLKIHWVKHKCKDSWFADPFILKETEGSIHILVEEFFYSNNKGRISLLVVNRNKWVLEQIIPVIELDTHLSFPAYYRKGGKVYIYPESTKSGKLTLYEYDEKEGYAVAVKVICNRPLADAIIYDLDGNKVVLATTSPGDNGKVLDIYPYQDNPNVDPERRCYFKTNVARNAGLPFMVGNRVIRPAQDCTRSYGSCVVLQEMIVDNGKIEFNEIKRIYSPLFNYHEAFHTFNVFENRLVAVDAEGFRYGLLAQIIYHTREMFRRWSKKKH